MFYVAVACPRHHYFPLTLTYIQTPHAWGRRVMPSHTLNDDRAIHCGCGDRDHAHGSCCGCASGNGEASEICTSGEVYGSVHPVAICRRTSPHGCAFHSTAFHPANEPHPRRRACPRIPQRQNRAGSGRPKRSSVGRTCRTHFRSRASTRTSPGYLRTLCTAGPTHGIETSYPA